MSRDSQFSLAGPLRGSAVLPGREPAVVHIVSSLLGGGWRSGKHGGRLEVRIVMEKATESQTAAGECQAASFRGWAVVEVMGHQTHMGFVYSVNFGSAVLFQIDAPGFPEQTLPAPHAMRCRVAGAADDQAYLVPKGAMVRRLAVPGSTIYVGAASIYRIRPTTEEAVREIFMRLDEFRYEALEVPPVQEPEMFF